MVVIRRSLDDETKLLDISAFQIVQQLILREYRELRDGKREVRRTCNLDGMDGAANTSPVDNMDGLDCRVR